MAKVLRRSIPHWLWLLIVMMLALAVFGWMAINKPLPEYLVAKGEVPAGTSLQLDNFELVPLNLGVVAGKYLSVDYFDPELQVIDTIGAGELLPLSNLTLQIQQGQTAIRLLPALEVPQSVVAGSWVSIWRVVEQNQVFTTELLVPRSKVVSVIAPDGLFANNIPQVELLIENNASTLVMQSITAENDIYILPLP